MPQYHFNLSDGVTHPDLDGDDLPNIDAAAEVAIQHLAEMLKGRAAEVLSERRITVTISDENGRDLKLIALIVTDLAATGAAS